jgi:hypothetical protein
LNTALNPLCPSDETLALFVAGDPGDIDEATRKDVLAHIETCSDCMAAVLAANAHLAEERSAEQTGMSAVQTRMSAVHTGVSAIHGSAQPRWWLGAVAAAIIVAVIGFPMLRHGSDPMARLVSVAPASARPVEPRLSGGFAWAPYRGPMRSGDSAVDVERMKLQGAAGEVIERAQRDRSPEAQRAAAGALVLVDRPAEAIDRLRTIAQASPRDARAWNDLAAARYAAALQLERPSLLAEALAAADRALSADPKSAEALFNRALIVERMGLTDEAKKAWLRYLETDSGSPWSAEARAHLQVRR